MQTWFYIFLWIYGFRNAVILDWDKIWDFVVKSGGIVATIGDIVATFRVILATLDHIVATIQFSPNSHSILSHKNAVLRVSVGLPN